MRRTLLVALALVGCKKRHEISTHEHEAPKVAMPAPAPAPDPEPEAPAPEEPAPVEPAKPAPPPMVDDATCVRRDTGSSVADLDGDALRICAGPVGGVTDPKKRCLDIAPDGTTHAAPTGNDITEADFPITADLSEDHRTVSVCHDKKCISIAPQLAPGEEIFSYASDGLGDFHQLVTVTQAEHDPVYANVEIWDLATATRVAGTTIRSTTPTDISARMLGANVAIYVHPQHDTPDLVVAIDRVDGDQLREVERLQHVTESPVEMDEHTAVWIEADAQLHFVDLDTLKDKQVVALDWLVDPSAPGWKDDTDVTFVGRANGAPLLLASRGIFPGEEMSVGFLDLAGGKHVKVDVPICK